jgi:hypothetical protein
MTNVKVSSEFNKFLSRNAKAIEEAKVAENSMQTCKMPVGWKGNCVCVGGEAGKGKDRKDEKGNTQEGREYVRLEFSVINSEEYAGSKFVVNWSFWDTEKATAMDRFEWCLNELENMGLPGEIRRSPDTTMEEILGFFINGETVYECEVSHNAYRRGDQKEVKVRLVEAIDGVENMAPTSSHTPVAPEAGTTVKYMGKDWELVDSDGDDLVIKSKTSGQTRNIKASALD